jgi:hypothetical protein
MDIGYLDIVKSNVEHPPSPVVTGEKIPVVPQVAKLVDDENNNQIFHRKLKYFENF